MNFKITPLDPVLNAELSKDYDYGIKEFVQVGPRKWIYTSAYEKWAQKMYNFNIRPDDVWITGVPRSGTTMTQEIVWLLTHNLDYEKATEIPIDTKVPFFESCTRGEEMWDRLAKMGVDKQMVDEMKHKNETLLEQMGADKERRVIKSHSPFCLLNPDLLTCGAKVIYVARYVKDVVVSYYNLQKSIKARPFVGSFEKYYNYYENNLLFFNPYWEHLKQAWEKRNNDNFMFIFYEDITKDLRGHIKRIAEFIEIELTEEQLNEMENYFTFENFKKHKEHPDALRHITAAKDFAMVRQGKRGGWKEYFSEELNTRADKWITENVKRIGMSYPSGE